MDPHLLEIIRCPACRDTLEAGEATLTCNGCGLVYPVKDDIPILLVDEARQS